jgi:hypothetical protein
MKKFLLLSVLSSLLILPTSQAMATSTPAVSTPMHAKAVDELNLDFVLQNATGYDISGIQISPTSEEDWGKNILKGKLKDGGSASISFHPEAEAEYWDLQITFSDGEVVYWTELNLTEISKLTLYYDDESGETSADAE